MNTTLFKISLFALLGACLMLTSCSQKEVEQDEPVITPTEGLKAPAPARLEPQQIGEELKIAYFDYDKSAIRADARKMIESNARWLKKNPTANVQLEGHCDERGTEAYNYRLGERRAEAVKRILVAKGIKASRLSTVSYGADPGRSEKAMASNRKVLFVVVYPN